MPSDPPLIRPLAAGVREAVRSSGGLVAVESDRVVGFLTVVHHSPETSEISWMAVHADHRGRGIGRALIQRLTGDLRRQGRRLLLVLTVSELEDGAGDHRRLRPHPGVHRSVGFVPARELPDLWPGDKALLLAMPLG